MDLGRRMAGLGIAGSVRTGVALSDLTSYRIGGPAEVLVEPSCIGDVSLVLAEVLRSGAPLAVIGAGSNVLVPDEGLQGVVLRIGEPMGSVAEAGGVITAMAGCTDRDLAMCAAEAGIAGFEFLEDIPGTVGGAIVQNAEAWGDSVSDHLVAVEVVRHTGEVVTLRRGDLSFGYRDSTFKRAGDLVVAGARFAPPGRGDPALIRARMDEIRTRRHSRYPLEHPSCGSVFKRPIGDYAGRLIEQAGLGGLRVGGACVSTRHHNFIVNTGGATAADVRALVEMVRDRVLERFGVALERELVYL